ncbi:MAG: COP23 domain-containing protein, partial [Dolichospermum sp.]
PQQRCKIVSQNFQTAFNNGSLNYVTNAFQNGNKVICSVSSIDGGCDTVLFTLRPQDKSKDVLKRLNKLWFGSVTADSGSIIQQSPEKKFYIDSRQFLNTPPAKKMK